jgi:A-kinase anchor protein 9
MYLKAEDRKQFGAVEAKAELSLEVQLQAERDAIDRKEKEVSLFLNDEMWFELF